MKTTNIRDFLRGGYQDLAREGVVVMKHGQPMFTAMPYLAGVKRDGATPVIGDRIAAKRGQAARRPRLAGIESGGADS